jgi:hypothetical protein
VNRNLPVVTEQKSHSSLGASTSHRWLACPGSVNLIDSMPEHVVQASSDSPYAREGSAAHKLAELALKHDQHPDLWEGHVFYDTVVTEEMVNHVATFVEYVRTQADNVLLWGTERSFKLDDLNPPRKMWGTTDSWIYFHDEKMLEIVDLKYGVGVVVEAKDNPQLRYYALGAVLEIMKEYPGIEIEKIRLTIIQPRAAHPDGVIRHDMMTLVELFDFSADLMAGAERTVDPNAPLVAGEHCRFCPAASICPELKSKALAVAQDEFSDLPSDVPPEPVTLPSEVLGDLLNRLPVLEHWASALRAEEHRRQMRGESVPGRKLVARRSHRNWADEQQTRDFLAEKGVAPEVMVKPTKLKSPAQIERLIGKKNLPEHLVQKKQGGYVSVPLDDPRPAVALSAADEFLMLEGEIKERDNESE